MVVISPPCRGGDALDQQVDRAGHQDEPERGVQLKQQRALKHRPGDAPNHAAEVLRRIGPWMVGGDLHEQVGGHTKQELDDQRQERRQAG